MVEDVDFSAKYRCTVCGTDHPLALGHHFNDGEWKTMPINPWTRKPHNADSVTRILIQLSAAHAACDEYEHGNASAEATIWCIKKALGRIAEA